MTNNQNLLGTIALFLLVVTLLLDFGFALSSASAVLDTAKIAKMQNNKEKRPQVSFSHVHLYVDHLDDLEVYKDLESRLNQFANDCKAPIGGQELDQQRELWTKIQSSNLLKDPALYIPQNRDLVQQLLSGFGFRVTGCRYPLLDNAGGSSSNNNISCNTRSVLVTSKDPSGVQFLLTAKDPTAAAAQSDDVDEHYRHFDIENVDRFYESHAHRPGIAVLAFLVKDADIIHERYKERHPNLLLGMWDYPQDKVKILEVYAYYDKDKTGADKGTVLRFVQDDRQSSSEQTGKICPVPGLKQVDASFDDSTQAAYCDHWVSNVLHRQLFLDTLEDTLDFTPKVDFNAGVVAAGEAQIESTVTGNDSALLVDSLSKDEALKDQSQVYLPINNALSEVGHVHGFLEELGQGIQHIASRVDNLIEFIQRANDYRKITGEGFTFLNIPRSYYGVLTPQYLMGQVGNTQSSGEKDSVAVSEECVDAVIEACKKGGVAEEDGAVYLELTRQEIEAALEKQLADSALLEEYQSRKEEFLEAILHSRYSNLYSLLRHHVTEDTYLGIVRNKILVDVQGDDLLYQIFTSNILQRNPGDEAPFLEFIQRVCSVCKDDDGCAQKVKPGCGGFGIRNFLTLFLSIEVSKAMREVAEAKETGDPSRQEYGQQMVDAFTRQMNEANPILTAISDAMTDEGRYLESIEKAVALGSSDEDIAILKAKMDEASARKQQGNADLMECSARYNSFMKELREMRASQ